MFGEPFGHGVIKKYVIFFGTLFNNLHIQRFDNTGALVQKSKVPLNYGPREKFLARADGNPDNDRQIAMQLPRISFHISNMYYDATRAQSRSNRVSAPSSDFTKKKFQYAPVPYNIDFQMSIMVKNAQDGTYIIEQILPYFQPDFTATLILNPDLDIKYDVPLNLNSISQDDTYEGDFINRRAVIWELNFTLKGWMFGPTNNGDGKIIREINLGFGVPGEGQTISTANSTNSSTLVGIDITPGQAANGSAVSWYGDSNAATRPNVVNPDTISPDEQYGFMKDFTESIDNDV